MQPFGCLSSGTMRYVAGFRDMELRLASRTLNRDGANAPPAKKASASTKSRDVEELSTPRTPVIYEVVRRLGDEEMERPATSLWWSGVAAGLSISFSLLAQAILQSHLPDTPWRPLVAGFGYCVGFLMVVLGRQQLFTESTITVVLPVFKDIHLANVWRMLRLWAIVLVANLAGTLFAARLLQLHAGALPALDGQHAGDQPRADSRWAGGRWASAALHRAS